MQAKVVIDAGVCGFQTRAQVASADSQNVFFDVESTCDKIQVLAERLKETGELDAYQECFPGGEGKLFALAAESQPACCKGCAVPMGLFKAMQVAAGLALPKDVNISLSQE